MSNPALRTQRLYRPLYITSVCTQNLFKALSRKQCGAAIWISHNGPIPNQCEMTKGVEGTLSETSREKDSLRAIKEKPTGNYHSYPVIDLNLGLLSLCCKKQLPVPPCATPGEHLKNIIGLARSLHQQGSRQKAYRSAKGVLLDFGHRKV